MRAHELGLGLLLLAGLTGCPEPNEATDAGLPSQHDLGPKPDLGCYTNPQTHVEIINASIRRVEKDRLEAEPSHVEALQAFAERAYRRPLTAVEKNDLLGFYQSLREKDGLSHEDAIRDTVCSILMSPNFLFRLDLDAPPPTGRPTAQMRTASARTAPASSSPRPAS